MKRPALLFLLVLPAMIAAQEPVIIDHSCSDLSQIPIEWIENAKDYLHIGYGHTSHGSQLTSGMDAIESFYADGIYEWSHEGGPGELLLFEGAGYGSGYLELDCGYEGWADETREYLADHPECNVIIWSWCGQVNNVDVQSHYLEPMAQLEEEHPDVYFVYMTGHLEGEGPDGSLFMANQQIRDYCISSNKILFDFADIEKYDPDADFNYQEYYADDACNYTPPGGGSANWANDWLAANPEHELTQISQNCGSCAHSVSLNCVKKGIACWHLWARLAGWNGPAAITEQYAHPNDISIKIYPNPAKQHLNIILSESIFCNTVELWDIEGSQLFSQLVNQHKKEFYLADIDIPDGIYVVRIVGGDQIYQGRVCIN